MGTLEYEVGSRKLGVGSTKYGEDGVEHVKEGPVGISRESCQVL